MVTQHIRLKGLTCAACAKLAQKRLQQLPQVSQVAVQVNSQAEIVAERNVSPAEIEQSLADTPYRLA